MTNWKVMQLQACLFMFSVSLWVTEYPSNIGLSNQDIKISYTVMSVEVGGSRLVQKFSHAIKATFFSLASSFAWLFILKWSLWGDKVVADMLCIIWSQDNIQRKSWGCSKRVSLHACLFLRENEIIPRRVPLASHCSEVCHMTSP